MLISNLTTYYKIIKCVTHISFKSDNVQGSYHSKINRSEAQMNKKNIPQVSSQLDYDNNKNANAKDDDANRWKSLVSLSAILKNEVLTFDITMCLGLMS